MRKKWITIGLVCSFVAVLSGDARPSEKRVLALVRSKLKMSTFSLYNIKVSQYTAEDVEKTVGTELEDDLVKCRVLFLAPKSSAAVRAVFGNTKYHKPLRAFLARGGTIYFGRSSYYRSATEFLKSLGITEPSLCEKSTSKSYAAELTDEGQILGEKPNKVGREFSGGYGAWIEVPPGLNVLARMKDEPKAAALVEKQGVEGKGRILFSQLHAEVLATKPGDRVCFENMWSHLLGQNVKAEGPGKTKGIVDSYRAASPECNPLYLSRAKELPWWNKEYAERIPVVIAEPVGLKRRHAPVSVTLRKQAKTYAVVTHAVKEVVNQVSEIGDGKTRIVLQTDLEPYEHKLFYVYVSDKEHPGAGRTWSLAAGKTDGFIDMANDAIRVKLYQAEPAIASLRLRSDGLGDAVANYSGINYGTAMDFSFGSTNWQWETSKITERGPVFVSVTQFGEYRGTTGLEVGYTIFAGDVPYVVRTIRGRDGKPPAIHRISRWAPGGRCDNTVISYESRAGIKQVRRVIGHKDPVDTVKYGDIRPFMKEGWYSFEDLGGEVVGECFDLDTVTRVTPSWTYHYAEQVRISGKTDKMEVSSVVVLDRGDWNRVRNIYVAFKNPPVVARGEWQPYTELTVPKPDPTKDFYRVVYLPKPHFYIGHMLRHMAPEQVAQRNIRTVLGWGANVIRSRSFGPKNETTMAYWNELVRLAAIHGIAFYAMPPVDNPLSGEEIKKMREASTSSRICPVAFRKAYHERRLGDLASACARHGGGDLVHVMDEYSYTCMCDKCKALFRKRYGGELPPATGGDMKDPNYANSILFRIEVITETARDMAKAVRKENPKATTFSVVNLKGVNKLYRLTDMEEHSRYLDMGGVDLYGGYDYYRSVLMFTRGAYGNRSRIENCVGYQGGKYLEYQMDLTTTYGSSILYFASGSDMQVFSHRVTKTAAPYLLWLKLSGYHRLLSGMQPVKHAAVLRDRNLLFESIKHGEADDWAFVTERALYALANLKGIQMDMVFSRFFEPEALQDYRLLLVPDNKYLSKDFAGTMKAFAEQGGLVYVEGESCKANSVMQGLCTGGEKVAGIKGFDLFLRNVGSGKVLYTPGFLSEKLPRDLELTSEFKKALAKHAGVGPVTVTAGQADGLDHMLFSDGKRYMLNVLNESPIMEQKCTATLHEPVAKPAMWVNMRTGESGELDGPIAFSVEPRSASFFLISPKSEYTLPSPQVISARLRCYSENTGMEFLNVELEDDEKDEGAIARVRGMINVGVFVHPASANPKKLKGQIGVKEELDKSGDMAVTAVQDLSPETLMSFDVLVVPNIFKANPPPEWEGHVRDFVASGGNVLLIHHAVGYGSDSGVMFPEIGRGVDYTTEVEFEVVDEHPIVTGKSLKNGVPGLAVGGRFTSDFPDYITIAPGAGGKVVVKSIKGRSGDPEDVVVVGEVGKGKVVLCGMNIGCQALTTDSGRDFVAGVTKGGEYEILLNSIRWLGQ